MCRLGIFVFVTDWILYLGLYLLEKAREIKAALSLEAFHSRHVISVLGRVRALEKLRI